MEGNDLVAEHVVPRRDARGDSDSPAVVVGDQLIGCPRTREWIVVDQADTVDLVELQGGFVDRGAFSVAVSKVVDDRAVMTLWPSSPLELDFPPGFDRGRCLTWGGAQMADDLWGSVVVWVDEASTLILWNGPTNNFGGRSLVLQGWGVPLVVDPVGHYTGDNTVRSDVRNEEKRSNKDRSSHDRHFQCVCFYEVDGA